MAARAAPRSAAPTSRAGGRSDRFGLSRAFTDSGCGVRSGRDGVPLLDLDYSEDSNADTDMNVVMTATAGDRGEATAERTRSRARPSTTCLRSQIGHGRIGDIQEGRGFPCTP